MFKANQCDIGKLFWHAIVSRRIQHLSPTELQQLDNFTSSFNAKDTDSVAIKQDLDRTTSFKVCDISGEVVHTVPVLVIVKDERGSKI